jgi:4a-hydroxytetrahydrobiopterin dehydratase
MVMDEPAAPPEPGTLASRTCVPCRSGVPPLGPDAARALLGELNGAWRIVEGKRLEREFALKNFRRAMDLAQAIGVVAEEQQHHPDLCVGWGSVRVTLFTHAIGGLHQNDFILAAKIDLLTPG